MPALSSTNLAYAEYDPDTEDLVITFARGDVYTYKGVPEEIYQGLISAPSPGKFFNVNIRDEYPYEG